jgi:hypothetical protein
VGEKVSGGLFACQVVKRLRLGGPLMPDYRTRIYKEYASRMQDDATIFDEA